MTARKVKLMIKFKCEYCGKEKTVTRYKSSRKPRFCGQSCNGKASFASHFPQKELETLRTLRDDVVDAMKHADSHLPAALAVPIQKALKKAGVKW